MKFSNTHNFKNPVSVEFEVKVNEDGGDFVVDIIDGKDFYECKSWHKNWAENSSGFFDQWHNYVKELQGDYRNLNYRFHPESEHYYRYAMNATDFENVLIKYKDQIEMTQDALDRYELFFKFKSSEMMTINGDVLNLIKLIGTRFDEIFK